MKTKSFSNVVMICSTVLLLLAVVPMRGQVGLPVVSPYVESFDSMGTSGTSLPTGWGVYVGATGSGIGTEASIGNSNKQWSGATGQFGNHASADIGSDADLAAQQSASDRVLAIRQSAAFGDSSAAFMLTLSNTLGLASFSGSFKLQQLHSTNTGRTATWVVQCSSNGILWTNATTVPNTLTTVQGVFSNEEVTFDFGDALDNISSNVYIRVVTLSKTVGSGSRPHTGIDDFSLSYQPSGSNLCEPPTDLTESEVLYNGATLNWTASTSAPEKYAVHIVSADGFDKKDTVSATSYNITDLNASTTYSWSVQSLCGASGSAVANDLNGFTTLAASVGAVTITVTSPDNGAVITADSVRTEYTLANLDVAGIIYAELNDGSTLSVPVAAGASTAEIIFRGLVTGSYTLNARAVSANDEDSVLAIADSVIFTVNLPSLENDTALLFEPFDGFAAGSLGAGASSTNIQDALDNYTQVSGWSGLNVYQAGGAAKMGKTGEPGWLQTPSINVSSVMDRKVYVSFKAMAWNKDATSMQLIINDEIITVEPLGNTDAYTLSSFTFPVPATAVASGVITVRLESLREKSSRFFIDDVLVYYSAEAFDPILSVQPSSLTLQTSQGVAVNGDITVSGEFLTSDVVATSDNTNFTLSSELLPAVDVLAGAPLIVTYNGALVSDSAVITFTSGSAIASLKVYGNIGNSVSNIKSVLHTAVYPNPSDGHFNVSVANGVRYEVIDMRGCIVDYGTVGNSSNGSGDNSGSTSVSGSGVGNKSVSNKHLHVRTAGIYLLRLINSSGKVATQRIVVK
jgi:hypothetical protein